MGSPSPFPSWPLHLVSNPPKIPFLYRLMQMLVHSGFFEASEAVACQESAYDLMLSSRLLVTNNLNCLSSMMVAFYTPEFGLAFDFLADWFRGNEKITPFEHAWEYLLNDKNQECKRLFSEGMASDSRMVNLVVRESKPVFEGLRSLVDVGGGTKALARAISEVFPDVKCTVLDLPPIVANLTGTRNLDFVGGDMFQQVPSADAIVLKFILHDWNDKECVEILENCKKAISGRGEGGKIIIIDIVIDAKRDEHQVTETKLLLDMLMMGVVSGKERDEKDWEKLFLEAGYSHFKITPLFGLRSLIQLYP